jgi:uncharacterized protein YcaQ
MLEEEKIIQVKVEENKEHYYAFSHSLNNISKSSSKISILSPFDNMIIQRKKMKTFFNFDYQIECYVPASKRKYGYFCLPVFAGSQAIARIDCKAYRGEQRFAVHSIHYEKGVDKDPLQFLGKLKSFVKFNGCSFN